MAAAHHSLNGPSFDLGIDDDSQDVSLLIVEDSLDKDEETDPGEVMSESNHADEVTAKKTELSNGIEDGESAGKFMHDFDLNKIPDEDVHSVNVCNDVEEGMKSGKVKNLRQKVIQPYERALLDLNRGVFDLNKFPDEGLDFGLESEELKKGVHDMLKIYLDSLY